MNQKEYDLIAATVYDQLYNANWNEERKTGIKIFVDALADRLEIYASFDRKKFLKACGL
jgi:hypothetical protein